MDEEHTAYTSKPLRQAFLSLKASELHAGYKEIAQEANQQMEEYQRSKAEIEAFTEETLIW